MKVIYTDEPMGFADMLVTRWFVLRRGEVFAILLSAAILIIVAVALVKFPIFGRTGNFAFGPDWECSYPGHGEPVCVKKPTPSAPTQPFRVRGGG